MRRQQPSFLCLLPYALGHARRLVQETQISSHLRFSRTTDNNLGNTAAPEAAAAGSSSGINRDNVNIVRTNALICHACWLCHQAGRAAKAIATAGSDTPCFALSSSPAPIHH